jgi:hypothetical protein
MTATYGAIGRIDYGTRTNTTIPLPASVGAGDHMTMLHITANSGTAVTQTLPAGWTQIGTAQTGTDGSFGWRLVMAERTATSSESNPTVTHASTGSEALILRTDGTGTLSIDVFSQANRTGSSTEARTATSVTTTVTDALLLYFCLNWDEVAFTPPTGMTERQDAQFLYVATEARSASGATGTRAVSGTTPNPWFANLIAIKDVSGGGDQALTPSLFTNTNSFYSPTVLATYSLTPALYSDADSFYAPTVTPGAVTLTASLFSDADSFFSATVSPGAVTLTPSLFSDGDSFYSATVSATYTLTPGLYSDADSFYSPAVAAGAVTLTPGLFSDADSFFSPTVSLDGGEQTLTPDLFSDGDTFYSATVTAGAITLTPALFTDADSFYSQTVSATYTLSPGLFSDGDTFHSPTVEIIGDQALLPDLFSDGDTFFTHVITGGSGQLPGQIQIIEGGWGYRKPPKRKTYKELLEAARQRDAEEEERRLAPTKAKAAREAVRQAEIAAAAVADDLSEDHAAELARAVVAAQLESHAQEAKELAREIMQLAAHLKRLQDQDDDDDEVAVLMLLN